ncbi:glycosyltransferase [Escherichia coli]|uniref:glycosyltransferase n=1 Tax=Escherichia coli TaxID=562 RepID=UPI00203031FA|nr:glycosyltransferase [Escherichia coli]
MARPSSKNQILSLQQQTFSNWRLFIQDDGSTDNTISIIKKLPKNLTPEFG